MAVRTRRYGVCVCGGWGCASVTVRTSRYGVCVCGVCAGVAVRTRRYGVCVWCVVGVAINTLTVNTLNYVLVTGAWGYSCALHFYCTLYVSRF